MENYVCMSAALPRTVAAKNNDTMPHTMAYDSHHQPHHGGLTGSMSSRKAAQSSRDQAHYGGQSGSMSSRNAAQSSPKNLSGFHDFTDSQHPRGLFREYDNQTSTELEQARKQTLYQMNNEGWLKNKNYIHEQWNGEDHWLAGRLRRPP